MRDLDETDLDILRLLVEDARRPYSEIADRVGVSPPTVSDRVDRLEELGVIRRFTLDIDQAKLVDGVSVLVELAVEPGHQDDIERQLSTVDPIEHVFATADATIVCTAVVRQDDVTAMLADAVDLDRVRSYDVSLLSESSWNPRVSGTAFALECDECGNSVTSEGVSVRIDGDLHHFCCSSCRTSYEEQYERLKESAD